MKRYFKFTLFLLLIFSNTCSGQEQRDSVNYRRRQAIVTSSTIATAALSYTLLNELWYKNYPRATMHSFNDNSEWLQVDKCGHAFTGYTLTKQFSELYAWASPKQVDTWRGATTSMLYLTSIELLDGRSAQWGFSWGDMFANAGGILLHTSQQFFWKEQRIALKFSYAPSPFASMNSDVLGRNFQQRLLKDYNAQTYWASFNIYRFLPSSADFPRWMNIAIGYGATKMIGANFITDDVNNFQRQREFYFSIDADLESVQWKKKWMRRTAKVLSFIKIPGPTLEIRESGKIKFHGLFF